MQRNYMSNLLFGGQNSMKTLALFLITILPSAQGALISGTTWEVRQGSSNNNGGGFVPTGGSSCGTDYSQQASPQIAYTDMVVATTTFTSVANPVTTAITCNVIQIISGTGCTAGFYYVVSTSSLTATLDRSAGTGSCTANLGGAIGTLAELNTVMGLTNNITQTGWVKANATYQISGAVTFNMTNNTHGVSININGYTTTRGDNGQPTIQATSTGFTMVTISNNNDLNNLTFRNFVLDCNSEATSSGFLFNGNGNSAANLQIKNCKGGFAFSFGGFGNLVARNIYATNYTGSTSTFVMGQTTTFNETCMWCVAVGNTAPGFTMAGPGVCISCIAANNTGASTDGFLLTSSQVTTTILLGSVAYGNGRDGIRFEGDASSGSSQLILLDSILYGNAGYGFNNTGTTGTATSYGIVEDYNGFGSNTSGATNNLTQGTHDVALTANPFTNGAGNIFTLNSTAGGGLSLQAAGFPGALQAGGTGYLDIGALQHQVTGNGPQGFGFVGP
jgi:hypothetical protein